MLAVATAGLLVNVLCFWILSRGDRRFGGSRGERSPRRHY